MAETAILQILLRPVLSNKNTSVTHLFIAHYRAYPCTVLIQASISSAKLHVSAIRRYLEIDHKYNSLPDRIKREYHSIARPLYATDFLADLDNGIKLDCEDCQLIITIHHRILENLAKSNGKKFSFRWYLRNRCGPS